MQGTDDGQHNTTTAGSSTPSNRCVVGIVADPDLATDIVSRLKDQLPRMFRDHVDDSIEWEVQLKSEALPLDEDGNITIWQNSDRLKSDEGWDLLICLTELTRRTKSSLLVSDVSVTDDAALISLPALGPVRLRHHVRNVMVRAVRAIITKDAEAAYGSGHKRFPRVFHHLETPVEEGTADDGPVEEGTADDGPVEGSSTGISGFRASLRLMAGMVRINRPWRLVPSLSSALAAAVATAAFGVFYSTIWQMADSLSSLRLLLISLIAITAMTTWLITYNGLWQNRRSLGSDKDTAIYNASTVLTLLIGVTCMYAVLFTVIFLGAVIIIPPDFLESTLEHQSDLMNYVSIAWLASSLGTFAGALGSTFETDDAIREATYGKREQERHTKSESDED